MYRDGKMLGNNAVLLICFLFCINNVLSTDLERNTDIEFEYLTYTNGTNYDVTTIYRIQDYFLPNLSNFTKSGFLKNDFLTIFEGKYSVDIHSRTNAIGMLVNNPNRFGFRSKVLALFDDNLLKNNITENDVTYKVEDWNIYFTGQNDILNPVYTKKTPGINWRYIRKYWNTNIDIMFSFSWTPQNDPMTCVSLTYEIRKIEHFYYYKNYYEFELNIRDQYLDTKIASTSLIIGVGTRTLRINNMYLLKGRKYELLLKVWCSGYCDYIAQSFVLKRISQCSTTADEDYFTQLDKLPNTNNLMHPYSFNILGDEEKLPATIDNTITSGCSNGGYKFNITSDCICPPGFKGQFCETGCGSNSFGADCKGICSINDRMCRGMLMCTTYGCTCPVGLTGPWCDKDCDSGKYGADCKQTCSSHCYDNMCDRYTGICSQGCIPGYVLPHCLEKYPYLINPPELISSKYESLEIKLNLSPTNLKGGDTNIGLKYFQLYYKVLGEESYKTSEFISVLNESEITSILSGLEPGTTYVVGALLITNDGNFNEQDIIYGQYNTSCMQPRTPEYNVKIVNGIKSLNITWDSIQTSRTECEITEYVLTLTSDISKNPKILSTSGSGLYLNDLISSIDYKLKLTAKTMNGLLESSPTYTETPLMKENDVEITNVSTIITHGKIKVLWKLLNSNQQINTLNGPVTFTVKYKVMRVLSCSLQEVENEWTSLRVVNRTSYEIVDTVPNSQYTIRVIVGDDNSNKIHPELVVYALTPISSPSVKPILDIDHPMYVTNNSVFVQWKVDHKECSKLNGFFSKFYFELKDKDENVLRTDEIKENNIYIDNLKPNASHELKVFVKTNFGYSLENYLVVNFKTKNGNLELVDDLMVYKKSLKSRMVGLRWYYIESTDVDGFIVSFDENAFTNTTNSFIIPPEKCLAWPEFYCHTFYNLTFNKNYTFKIKPKSVDYPEGGKVSSVSFSAIDGLPDPPTNIKATEVGNTTINLEWDIPWIFNGVLKTFIVNVEEISSTDVNSCCTSITPIEIPIDEELPTYNYTLKDLRPGSTYSIGVITVSKSSWYSSPARISVTTLI